MRKRMAWVQNGIITNFIVIRDEQIAEFLSDGVSIVDPGGLNVHIGDTWDGERFYRDGEPITDAE
jgi:hypothetical protein